MNHSEEAKRQSQEDSEVNFEPIIAWFLGVMDSIKHFFIFIAKVVKDQRKIVMIFTVIGFLAGILSYFFLPKRHVYSALIQSKYSSNLVNYSALVKIGDLANDKSYTSLANTLDIPEEEAEKIKHISYLTHSFKEIDETDTVPEKKPFVISLSSLKLKDYVEIQESIVSYLENLPMNEERLRQRKTAILSRLKQNRQEIKELDSLKKVVQSSILPRSQGNGIILGEPISPITIYQESERLSNEIISLNNELETLRVIKIESPFIFNEKAVFPRVRHCVLIFVSTILLGIIVGVFVQLNSQKELSK